MIHRHFRFILRYFQPNGAQGRKWYDIEETEILVNGPISNFVARNPPFEQFIQRSVAFRN